jgi:hypothetical protein
MTEARIKFEDRKLQTEKKEGWVFNFGKFHMPLIFREFAEIPGGTQKLYGSEVSATASPILLQTHNFDISR